MAVAKSRYITNAEYRRQKTNLTRAINSGKCVSVLVECERVLGCWHGKAWPDDWARWARAVEDAFWAYRRTDNVDERVEARFIECIHRFA